MGFALQILSPAQRRGRQAWTGECGPQASAAVLSSGGASRYISAGQCQPGFWCGSLWQVPGHQPTAGRKKLCSFGINA